LLVFKSSTKLTNQHFTLMTYRSVKLFCKLTMNSENGSYTPKYQYILHTVDNYENDIKNIHIIAGHQKVIRPTRYYILMSSAYIKAGKSFCCSHYRTVKNFMILYNEKSSLNLLAIQCILLHYQVSSPLVSIILDQCGRQRYLFLGGGGGGGGLRMGAIYLL